MRTLAERLTNHHDVRREGIQFSDERDQADSLTTPWWERGEDRRERNKRPYGRNCSITALTRVPGDQESSKAAGGEERPAWT